MRHLAVALCLAASSCATSDPQPQTAVTSSAICTFEDGVWVGECGTVIGGGDGGDPGDGTCHSTPCTYDLECQWLCWNGQARCQLVTVGPYQWSGCVDG